MIDGQLIVVTLGMIFIVLVIVLAAIGYKGEPTMAKCKKCHNQTDKPFIYIDCKGRELKLCSKCALNFNELIKGWLGKKKKPLLLEEKPYSREYWVCILGPINREDVPKHINGFDSVPRMAAIRAVEEVGIAVENTWSGWGADEATKDDILHAWNRRGI